MKQLFLFFLLITFSVSAQDYSLVDEKVKNYPKLVTAETLAELIDKDFSSDTNKVRAIYFWLTHNISYDLAEFYSPTVTSYSFSYSTEEEKQRKIKALDDKIISKTLSERKAVCEGYARTFSKLCNLLKIENAFIKGYVRNSVNEIDNPIADPNHAWNAVMLNGVWKFFDATWGAGYEMYGKWKRSFNNYFFDVPKDKLFFTHFPEEKLWHLRVKRMTKDEFYTQPIYKKSFFTNNLELISQTKGTIFKNENGEIEIVLKNLKNKKVFFGFKGSRYSKRPIIISENNLSKVKITPPEFSEEAYLLIGNDVVLEFKIQ